MPAGLLRTLPYPQIGIAVFTVLLPLCTVHAQASRDNPSIQVLRSGRTGQVTYVIAEDEPGKAGKAVMQAAARGKDPVKQYSSLFGITNADQQLRMAGSKRDRIEHQHTQYQQMHKGVPVFGGVFRVHQDRENRFRSANGKIFPIPDKLGTEPALNAADAVDTALKALNTGTPRVEKLELVVVDPGWYGNPSTGARLAWHVILNGSPAAPVREGFFIDAHSGGVLDRWNMLARYRERQIHDGEGLPDLPGSLVRVENAGPCGIMDADKAYDYAGDFYDYFHRAFGRDSLDDNGKIIRITVNSTTMSCPNAFWDGEQAGFCSGLVVDDILAHELMHAVTQYEADMIYQNQPGQLNESYSDIFGELVDLFNGDAAWPGTPGGPPNWPEHPTGPGTDTPNNLRTTCSPAWDYIDGVRWVLGEDVGGGPSRDMWNPPCYNDPDRSYSPLQTCPISDNGGIHTGSGIPNHAFSIMTDGKTFNGQTVVGIGPIKSGAVWYRALTTYLTITSDFQDAYYALTQAAQDLIGTYPNDPRTGLPSSSQFTAFDAEQVNKALLATEMNGDGACGAIDNILNPDPPTSDCYEELTIFYDDFENGVNGWTVSNTNPPTPYNWVQQTGSLPYARTGTAWFGEDRNIGDCVDIDESAVHYLTSPVINIPSNVRHPMFSFLHYIAIESGWDGGNVSICINGGSWQTVPSEAITYNTYNMTLNLNRNTNPLAGQPGWSGAGGSWGTSVVDLNGYVSPGQTLQVRFNLGKDGCVGVKGWYVDDFRVYDCRPEPTGTLSGTMKNNSGLPLRDTTLTITDSQLNTVNAITDSNGTFTVTDLNAGLYNVTAWKPGYCERHASNVRIRPNLTTNLDLHFTPNTNAVMNSGFNVNMAYWINFGNGFLRYSSGQWSINSYSGAGYIGWAAYNGGGGVSGGCYQSVTGLQPGRAYNVSAYAFTDSYDDPNRKTEYPNNVFFRIGFDPTGGTNPNSANVVWRSYANSHYHYTPLGITVTATQSTGVVFLQYVCNTTHEWNKVAVDDVYITPVACANLIVDADFNEDGHVDATDFDMFSACYNGPVNSILPTCGDADFNSDAHVDAIDFDRFSACYNGPTHPAGCE